MCCFFTILFLLGARAVDIVWWIAQPARWDAAFSSALWPILGIIVAPWTTMMWVICAPGGINGLDWLWIGLAIFVDVAFWGGGARGNRGRMPNSASTV
jgi:hypothetical protein